MSPFAGLLEHLFERSFVFTPTFGVSGRSFSPTLCFVVAFLHQTFSFFGR